MTGPENGGPWRPPAKDKQSKFPFGPFIWLALLIAVGLALWLLTAAFPGRLADVSDQVHVVQIVLILALVSSGLIFARKINTSKIVRDIALWVAIGAAVFLGYSYQDEIKGVAARLKAELVPSAPLVLTPGVVSLTREDDGHFRAAGWADNTRIRFLIDTGATSISLSPADAERIGVDLSALSYTTRFQTANGISYGAPYRLRVLSIGAIEFHDVAVSVSKVEMDESLLGMSFLNRLSNFEISGRKLILRR